MDDTCGEQNNLNDCGHSDILGLFLVLNNCMLDMSLQLSYHMAMEQDVYLGRSPISPRECNLAKALDLIGDRWSLLILRSVLYGVWRFDDLQAENDIPRSVLSARLKLLCTQGFLERRAYKPNKGRTRFEYLPTPKATAFILPFVAITQWSDAWLDESDEKPVTFVDAKASSPISVGFVGADGQAVPLGQVKPVFSKAPQP